MTSSISRRDFIKVAGLMPLSLASAPLLKLHAPSGNARNVIVVVFDAWSAYHLAIYGYPRETMPNLSRLAKRAIVYHNHFAAGNYTTPGTASLLTSTYPWTHRALNSDTDVIRTYLTRQLFSTFPDYYKVAYTHNPWAATLLQQFVADIQDLIPWRSLFLRPYADVMGTLFGKDQDTSSVAWVRGMTLRGYGYTYSLFLSHLYDALRKGEDADLKREFPRGVPTIPPDDDFRLETAVDAIRQLLPTIPQPFLGYFHFLPPHAPYNTAAEFYNRFLDDGYVPPLKPDDAFTQLVAPQVLVRKRAEYDEFILYVDREFGRLYESLQSSGLLENSWLILTSDHGEIFERGQIAHGNPSLYQAVVRVPLLIFEPGRETGMDIHDLTSAVDVLPTLAYVTGHPIPDWTEGQVMPPFAGDGWNADPSIYAVQARHDVETKPLTQATIMLVKGEYKLVYYFGYGDRHVDDLVKLYDIQADPEELVDLSTSRKGVADAMLQELKAKMKERDDPYR